MKILMTAPFDAQGRYQGGIHSIVNSVLKKEEDLINNDLEIIPFNTCQISRSDKSIGKLSFANIKNFFLIFKNILKSIKLHKTDILYYHSSVKLALLKDLLVIKDAKKKTKIKTVLHIHFADFEKIVLKNLFLKQIMLRLMKK